MFWGRTPIYLLTENAVYAKAFATLSRGLWLTLCAIVFAFLALLVFLAPLLVARQGIDVKPFSKHILVAAGVLASISLILNLWGKWLCFELQQPLELGHRLPGHRYLQIAFWCEVLSFVLKTSARTLGVAQLKMLIFPLTIVAQIVFMLFLRKIAVVIERPDLKRRIDYLAWAVSISILAFGTAYLSRSQGISPKLTLAALAISFLLFIASMLGYMVILAQMALAASAFSRYLKETEHDIDDDYETAELAQEPA
ncbi:hypothetical protein NA78x_004901 [Anatilimnocola sp. NA78]|uniref:hypothetical protein n=1 Tax=Anatilimnocola sp. NA78 TaxID=3415683 RepID=UPI003CE50D7D